MNFLKLAKLFSVALIMATAANAENVLRWTSQGDALTMDPHSQNESPTIAFNGQIYEALVARDIEMNLVPELAESWTASPDGWTFKLRQGVTFHDGADFTAEDVVFSFNRALEESSDYKEQVKTVAKVEVIDDFTIKENFGSIENFKTILSKNRSKEDEANLIAFLDEIRPINKIIDMRKNNHQTTIHKGYISS